MKLKEKFIDSFVDNEASNALPDWPHIAMLSLIDCSVVKSMMTSPISLCLELDGILCVFVTDSNNCSFAGESFGLIWLLFSNSRLL